MQSDLPSRIFQLIFEKSSGSLLVKADAPRFTVVAVNDTYLAITAKSREELVGKGFFEVFPDDENDFPEDIRARTVFSKVISTGEKIDVPAYRFDLYDPVTGNTEVRYWSCSNIPIILSGDRVEYILNTVAEITAEVNAREAAVESENRLRLAMEAAELAIWDLNIEDQTLIYSPRMAEIFGHPLDKALSLSDIRAQVNADDMANIVKKAYFSALITGHYLYEVRILWPDGSLHWIRTQGSVIKDINQKPVRILGTILDITESKRDEIRKNDFIAMASHELKTPLTTIKAYLQLLAKKLSSSNDAFVNNALHKAGYQINKMADLVHGFLDLSKLESGKLQLRLQPFDLNQLIAEVVNEILNTNAGDKIVFDPDGDLQVKADREKIAQVVNNFLSNAIKYSDRGSVIKVFSGKTADGVIVSVTDEGIGIKPKDQERLFQRFYRVESEKMKNISGFGIGLYLASEIIQRHNGQIGVQSDENTGSTFFFTLPTPHE